ncbi:MAG: substrate-binding domain-containing protein [Thermoflexales bacterium]|nr:substrate-binding domain-containing protein [Thermoflexales bacterium]
MNTTSVTSHARHAERPTIAYLAPNIFDNVNGTRWHGVIDAAQERDINLICFPGSYWHDSKSNGQANAIYDLVNTENMAGLVLGNIVREDMVDLDEFRNFYERHLHVPTVSIRQTLKEIPYIHLDNYRGMREIVAHLIEVHGLRRIAFLRGPEDHPYAQERYQAYLDALEEYGLPFEQNIITPPSGWNQPAIQVLLDERRLSPRVDFEAVVAVNDIKAIDALETFQARGIRVPDNVAIVGFNDDAKSRVTLPPLSSVALPFYEQGRRAVEMLLDLTGDKPLPEQVSLPAHLMVRQSCGCMPAAVAQAATEPVRARADVLGAETLVAASTAQREEILTGIRQSLHGIEDDSTTMWAEQLLDSFVAQVHGTSPDSFLLVLDSKLRQTAAANSDVHAWQELIPAMRRHLQPYLGDDALLLQANNLWQQAYVMIGEMATLAEKRRVSQAEQQARILHEISEGLITTFDVKELMEVVAEGLPQMGIPSCYLSLYENPHAPAEWSELCLAYDKERGGKLKVDQTRFPSSQLTPEGLLPQRRFSFVAAPLYFQETQIGFVLFEVGPRDANVYEVLRGELSSALQGALILRARQQADEALEKAYLEVEQQVKIRTSELEHETAERMQAQQENLRLQQEIIDAQKQAIEELTTPIIPVMDRIIVMPLIGSIDTLRAKDIMRALMAGIREHQAQVVILDITGVPVVDTGVANHLNKAIQAARLKGARPIVTGMSEAVAETIVDLGVDWGGVETLADLQTGLRAALAAMGLYIT